jgi:hypothetical protein
LNNRFIPGLDLCEIFYTEAVSPILQSRFPALIYSAALIGPGSEVLSFDTAQSMDHDWGPKLQIFLTAADLENYHHDLNQMLREDLPAQIWGYPTNFARHGDGTALMQASDSEAVDHGVKLFSVADYFESLLGFNPDAPIEIVDWLSTSEQNLLMATAGRVFHDGLSRLEAVRRQLSYYPHDLWLYLLAAQWRRIAQEEAFMGRCGQVGDDLGSQIVAARLVRDLMRLCFLMERAYAPYIKWFGSAFARLSCADGLTPHLNGVLAANSWQARQEQLSNAYQLVAGMHNALGITAPLDSGVTPFHKRPFLVLHADRFVDAIRAEISGQEVLALPEHLGSADQFIDSTDAIAHSARIRAFLAWHAR